MAQFNMSGQRVVNQVNVGSEQELAQKVLSLAQEALGTGFDWRMVDRVYFLKGKMQDIEKLCQEQLKKGST